MSQDGRDEKRALVRHLRRHHPNLLGSAMDWGSINWRAMADQDRGLGFASEALPSSGLSDVPLFVLEAVHRAVHMGLYFPHQEGDWLCREHEAAAEKERREAALDRINDDPAWAQRAYGTPGAGETHVDRVAIDPLSSSYQDGRLLARFPSEDDPQIGAQERDGWATYVFISEPHTMAECPFDADGRRK